MTNEYAHLTDDERDALYGADDSCGCGGIGDRLIEIVEQMIAARLARMEALAEKWNGTPDYTPTEYDQGRVDQRHDMTYELFEALSAPHEGSH